MNMRFEGCSKKFSVVTTVLDVDSFLNHRCCGPKVDENEIGRILVTIKLHLLWLREHNSG